MYFEDQMKIAKLVSHSIYIGFIIYNFQLLSSHIVMFVYTFLCFCYDPLCFGLNAD